MTEQRDARQEDAGAIPVTCTLSRAGLAEQAGRWGRLATRAMTGRAETAHGLRLSFRPGPGVGDELGRLVAVERECCAWADWTVQERGERIILDIRAAGDGVAALHAMFTDVHEPEPPGVDDLRSREVRRGQ